MIRITLACYIVALTAIAMPARAQLTAVQQHNARMMDSLQMEVITIWCKGQLDFPAKYSRHKTDQLTHILRTLNSLYTDTLTRSGLIARIQSLREGHVMVDSVQNNESTSIAVRISLPDYLQARLQFTCAGDHVIAQRYELQPETKIWANDHSQGFVDFNYCKTVYATALTFPVQYARNEYFYASLGL
ncbi:MAG TPA: hypothetical protein VGE93_07710 [Bryobacteraceae bacterium]